MSSSDLAKLEDNGFEIAAHTHHHKVLPRLSFDQQKISIERNLDFLKGLLGREKFTLSYPFGFHNDHTKRIMKELGVLAGFTLGRKLIKPQDLQSRWSIPRYDVNDCFNKKNNTLKHEVFSTLSTGD